MQRHTGETDREGRKTERETEMGVRQGETECEDRQRRETDRQTENTTRGVQTKRRVSEAGGGVMS